jgi:hypothetical protein
MPTIDHGKSSKRIRDPNFPVSDPMRPQHGPHEYCHSTAPNPRFDKIAWDAPVEHIDNASLHVVELAGPKHCLRIFDAIADFAHGFDVILGT